MYNIGMPAKDYRKEIDWAKAALYAEAQCSLQGIVRRLDVSEPTFRRAIQEEFDMSPKEWMESKRVAGKENILLVQYMAACQADQNPRYVRAAVWWGKQHLGQLNAGKYIVESTDNNVVVFQLPDNGRGNVTTKDEEGPDPDTVTH